MGTYSVLFKFEVWARVSGCQTEFWKTHPIFNFRIMGHDTDRFLENSSQIKYLVEKWYSKRIPACDTDRKLCSSGKLIQIWTSFPVIGLARAPIFYKNWIGTYKKLMDEFSRNRSSSYPGNWNFEKILNEFSRNPSMSHPGKLKFRKKFLDEFSRICQ